MVRQYVVETTISRYALVGLKETGSCGRAISTNRGQNMGLKFV